MDLTSLQPVLPVWQARVLQRNTLSTPQLRWESGGAMEEVMGREAGPVPWFFEGKSAGNLWA